MNQSTTSDRRGFVLLTVLWVLLGLAVLALGAALAARHALASARNRAALTVAGWQAEGCIERAHAAASEATTRIQPEEVARVWDTLDLAIAASPLVRQAPCTVSARPTGMGVDLNQADTTTLRQFFGALGIYQVRADSLIDALLDWRDEDTLPRPLGAERGWYIAARRPVPRDSQLADPRELLRIRGFERFGDTLSMVGVDNRRIALSHAPLPVVASLPGITPAALARLRELRIRREPLADILALGMTLTPEDRNALIEQYPSLSRRASPQPDTWLLIATASAGTPAVSATVEVVLGRAGARVAVLERR